MTNILIKLAVVLLGVLAGWTWPPMQPMHPDQLSGAIFGGLLAAALVMGLTLFERGSPGTVFGGIAGFVIAIWLAATINTMVIRSFFPDQAESLKMVKFIITVAFAAAGFMVGVRRGKWLTPANVRNVFQDGERNKGLKILDTSVIIDGRILDICETGFISGNLIVPKFVLKELQQIADSSQSLKRNRGRRGLDILQKIQKKNQVKVIISEQDFPDVQEVDLKLIELARMIGGSIITNDFNLNKVAQLHGLDVLNINALANALKPVVLPGEVMKVFILKEGKEANQGIGYLDDGTMIVVDNARQFIGNTIDLIVTSVLQTTAGKMIFGKTKEDEGQDSADYNNRRTSRNRT